MAAEVLEEQGFGGSLNATAFEMKLFRGICDLPAPAAAVERPPGNSNGWVAVPPVSRWGWYMHGNADRLRLGKGQLGQTHVSISVEGCRRLPPLVEKGQWGSSP